MSLVLRDSYVGELSMRCDEYWTFNKFMGTLAKIISKKRKQNLTPNSVFSFFCTRI